MKLNSSLCFYKNLSTKIFLNLLDQIDHPSSKARDKEMHQKLLQQDLTLQLLQYPWSRMRLM